jgi:hypothetical protein
MHALARYMTPNYLKAYGTEHNLKPTDDSFNGDDSPKGVGFRVEDSNAQILYCALAAFSIGLNVLVMGITSWCMIFGQDLAYRGDQGSMSRAVDGLYVERLTAVRIYFTAVGAMICSAVALTWLVTEPVGRRLQFLFMFSVGMIVTFLYMRLCVRPRFRFPDEDSVDVKLFGGSLDPEHQLTRDFVESESGDVASAIHYVVKSPLFGAT